MSSTLFEHSFDPVLCSMILLYICLARNVLGRVPLTPCFVQENRTPALPHSIGNRQGAAAAGMGLASCGNSSRLYELNNWMWRNGRGRPRQITVAEAELQWKTAISNASTRATWTLKRHREERGADYYSKDPRKRVRDLPQIEKLWCYIASYIPYYITHAIFSAIIYNTRYIQIIVPVTVTCMIIAGMARARDPGLSDSEDRDWRPDSVGVITYISWSSSRATGHSSCH